MNTSGASEVTRWWSMSVWRVAGDTTTTSSLELVASHEATIGKVSGSE